MRMRRWACTMSKAKVSEVTTSEATTGKAKTPLGGWGGMSERSRAMAAVPRTDDGLFGPGSIFWRMCTRDVTVGVAAMLLFMFPVFLYPASGQSWHRDRTYHQDPLGFVQRAMNLIFGMIFGDERSSRDTFARFRETHDTFNGRYDHSDRRFHGMDTEGMVWVVASLWYCLYKCNQAYSPNPLTPAERDQFFAEGVVFATECGIPRVLMPTTEAEYRLYFRDAADKMLITPDGAINIQRMMIHPDFTFMGGSFLKVINPLVWLFWRPILAGPLSLLPAQMQEMLGLRHWGRIGRPLNVIWRSIAHVLSSDVFFDRLTSKLVPFGPEGVGLLVAARCPVSVAGLAPHPQAPAGEVPVFGEYLDRFTPRIVPEPEEPTLVARFRYGRKFLRAQRRPL